MYTRAHWQMSEARHFVHILKTAPNADRAILVITFGLTVFADPVLAVDVGVILAILHVVRRMTEAMETQQLDAQELRIELAQHDIGRLPPGLIVHEIAGPMFFGSVGNFVRALLQTPSDPKALIIRLRHVPFMDITGIQTLEEVITKPRKAHVVGAEPSGEYACGFVDALAMATTGCLRATRSTADRPASPHASSRRAAETGTTAVQPEPADSPGHTRRSQRRGSEIGAQLGSRSCPGTPDLEHGGKA